MSSQRRKLLPLVIATLLSGPAAAVGLGPIQLQSALGKPLEAMVPLNHLGDLSADQLKVQIGSEADYQAMGVEFSYQHTLIKIEPVVQNGQGYLRITTREPVSEPYLNFVLNMHWPQGQVAREFTVLLDPPSEAGTAVASTADQSTVATPSAGLVAPAAAGVAAAPAVRAHAHVARLHSQPIAPAVVATPTIAAATAPAVGVYQTQRGDSLWKVASKLRPNTVPLAQMMSALLAANPQAFIDGNPGRLKEASTIVMPDAAQMAALGSAGAVAPVRTAAAPSVPLALPSEAPAVALQPLVAENATLKTEVNDLTSNVATLNQNLAASEQRLKQMETQLDDLMRQFQRQTASNQPTSVAKVAALPAAESVINQVNAAELTPQPAEHTPWWVHVLYWLGIAGLGAWVVREHFWPRRVAATVAVDPRKTRPDALPTPRLEPSTAWIDGEDSKQYWRDRQHGELVQVDVADAAPVVARESTAPPLDLELDLAPAGASEAVDASISAGVFVAFGRFDEAEKLLLDALNAAPGRADLKLQLLDVYLQADSRDLFEGLAAEVEREHNEPDVVAELAVLRDSFYSRH